MKTTIAITGYLQIPDQVKSIHSHFNYTEIWSFIQDKGIELYGKNFRLFISDTVIILKLIAWFIKDKAVAKQLGIDLEKGIMLVGPVGCGKTSLMNICRFLLPADQRHTIKPCRDISFDFIKEGHDVLYNYTRGSFRQSKYEPKTYCFDDLGTEDLMHSAPNQFKVMAEILLTRYDLFHSFGMITHLTTNLTHAEIESTYGLRVSSRCRELFNRLAFDKNTMDKRN